MNILPDRSHNWLRKVYNIRQRLCQTNFGTFSGIFSLTLSTSDFDDQNSYQQSEFELLKFMPCSLTLPWHSLTGKIISLFSFFNFFHEYDINQSVASTKQVDQSLGGWRVSKSKNQ